jgi:hypothetical protein
MFWKPNGTTMGCSFAQKTIMTQKLLKPKPLATPFFFFFATWIFLSFLLGRFIFELHSLLEETNSKSLA